jgi:hypothetical protein
MATALLAAPADEPADDGAIARRIRDAWRQEHAAQRGRTAPDLFPDPPSGDRRARRRPSPERQTDR